MVLSVEYDKEITLNNVIKLKQEVAFRRKMEECKKRKKLVVGDEEQAVDSVHLSKDEPGSFLAKYASATTGQFVTLRYSYQRSSDDFIETIVSMSSDLRQLLQLSPIANRFGSEM